MACEIELPLTLEVAKEFRAGDEVELTGYVCTGRDVTDLVAKNNGHWALDRDPYLLETSVPGVFAAGDVRHGSIKRVAAGVGEGSMAIAFVHQYMA